MIIYVKPIDMWSLPTVASATVVDGTTTSTVFTVELFDWGLAQGWSAAGYDLRGRLSINGKALKDAPPLNPVRAGFKVRHFRARLTGMPSRLSLITINSIADAAFNAAMAKTR